MTPDQIKQLRQHLKLTQRDLADRLHVDATAISHWERGKHTPSGAALDALKAIAMQAGLLPAPIRREYRAADAQPLQVIDDPAPPPKRERTVKPTTPGEMLMHEFLPGLGWSLSDLAQATGFDESVLAAVCADERPITPNLAIKLGEALGTTAQFWLNLQGGLDTYRNRYAKKDAQIAQLKRKLARLEGVVAKLTKAHRLSHPQADDRDERIHALESELYTMRAVRGDVVCAKTLARECGARDSIGLWFTSAIIALGHKLKLESAGHMRRTFSHAAYGEWEFTHEGQRLIRRAIAQGFKDGVIDDEGVTSFKLHTVERTFTLYR